MDKLQNYSIAFSGLKEGKHLFKFEIDKEFFKLFDTEQEFSNPQINIEVMLLKHSTFLEFEIEATGNIELVCDISNETFSYNINPKLKILVKYGDEYDDSNEEVIIIPFQDYSFNIAQLIYEMVMLSVPMKKLSPNYEEDTNQEEENTEKDDNNIDPRWAELLKLKENKKNK